MTKIIPIEVCEQCPHYLRPMRTPYEPRCTKASRGLLFPTTTIPSWCPLEDYHS